MGEQLGILETEKNEEKEYRRDEKWCHAPPHLEFLSWFQFSSGEHIFYLRETITFLVQYQCMCCVCVCVSVKRKQR